MEKKIIDKLINEIRDRLDILESVTSPTAYKKDVEDRLKFVNEGVEKFRPTLSNRTINSLVINDVDTIGDLIGCSKKHVSSFRSLGKASIHEINELLLSHFKVEMDDNKGIDVNKYIKTGKIELKEEQRKLRREGKY